MMLRNGTILSETLWECSLFGAWTILEKHSKEHCNCSYCNDAKLEKKSVFLWLPECKARNSWRVLVVSKEKHWYYLRSTLPSWKCIVNFYRWSKDGWRLQLLNLWGQNSLKGFLTLAKNSPYDTKIPMIESFMWIGLLKKVNIPQNSCVCSQNAQKMRE